MVNIQVYNEENKKIETVRCEENETMRNVQKLEDKYGETQETRIERDDSKKTPMIRYRLTTEEGYTIIVSMSIYQAERVNDYLTTYEAFAEVFTEEEVQERKATAPKHRFYRISQYRPNLKKGSHGIVKNGQWSQKCTAQGVEYALAHMGYNGRMVNEEITEIVAHFDDNGRIGAIWVKCSNPKYDWDSGYHSFMVHYRPRKFNYELTWEERDEEAHQELVKFLIEADKYFKEEGLNVKVRTYDRKRSDSIEGRAEELTMEELISSLVETPSTEETEAETEEAVEETIETEEGSEKMTEKTGYDKDDEDENMKKLSEICNKIRRLGATETTIAFNPIHNEDGSSDAKIYYYDGSNNEMFNECFDVNVKTIGELEYLKENLPNVVSDSATTFWDNPSLLFCNGFVIQDKEFQMVDGLILFCKIEGKKLYYRTYESGDWNEIKEESLEELKVEASKHPLGKWRYTGLGGTLGKMLYALSYYSTDIKMAVMSGYDSIYCEGTSLIGDTFQLRY